MILEVRGLEQRFGGLPALAGVDLEVGSGEIVAVIGPNGAGKSTLLRVVGGLQRPTAVTRLRFRGTDLGGLAPHRIRRLGIASVLQDPRIFEDVSVVDNVALGAMFAGPSRCSRREAIAIAHDRLELLGAGRDADRPAGELDLHQRRVVDLARALAGAPSLLLLDEVMAGLNPGELESYLAVLRRVRDELGVAMVWVEHVMDAVNALADRVVVLDLGRELAQGPPAEVMHDPAVIEAYLGRGTARPC